MIFYQLASRSINEGRQAFLYKDFHESAVILLQRVNLVPSVYNVKYIVYVKRFSQMRNSFLSL